MQKAHMEPGKPAQRKGKGIYRTGILLIPINEKGLVKSEGFAGAETTGWSPDRLIAQQRQRARALFKYGCLRHCLIAAVLRPLPVQRLFETSPSGSSSSSSSMSSASFWSDACETAKGKPLETLLNALYASCGATVRRARAADCALLAAV